MKKTFKALFTVLAAAVVTVLVGCASADTLMSRGDNVGAIEKLASTLTKKPNDQESADYFVSLYPSEVENRLQYTERNVPDIINDWVSAQGQTSLTSALKARKQAIGSSKFLADDGEIRSLINEMEITQKNLNDLERIQRAVVKMPSEIGELDVYFVEKYSDNFSGMSQIAKRSMAEFYYELGNAAAPGTTRSQKIALYDLYGKVNEYSTGYTGLNTKRAESAYAVAEDYQSGSTIEEKKEALNWFNKANIAVTNFNDTNTRIRETNYLIGLQYIADYADVDTSKITEYKLRSDLNNAIKYLEDSKGYKDASTWIAKCREILASLDNPESASRAADSGTGTSNTGTSNTGTTNTNTGTNNSSSGNATTPAVTAKASVLVPDSAKFSLGSNNKINAAVSVVTQGDVSLSKDRITFVTNTAGATVKSITVLKSIDSSFTKYKTRDTSAKTASYTINFELEKAGQFIFRILDAKGGKVDLVTANGKSDTISPSYTLSTTEYNKLIPAKEPTPSTPSTPSTPTVTAPVVLVDSNAKYSVVNKKVNATVNIAVEGDLSVTANNIKFDANTAGATVKSVAPTKAVDTSLTKIQTPVKTKGETTKVTGYTITFELSKAGQIVFRVLDAKGGKVQHNATNGNKDTCSPLYTLTEAEYNKLIPPAVTPTPTPVATKPTMVVDSAPKYSVVSNKVNAALNVIVVGDLALTKDNIKLSTNTAGATVKSVTAQKAVDATLSKSKPLASLKATAKTTGYVITFELAKAGNYSFGVIPSTTAKSATQIEIASIDGKTGTVSPTYTLTEAEYNKLIPPAQTTPTPTPVAKPSVLVSNTANYSVVSSKVNATVNIVVLGDLSLTKDNIKLSTNTAGATVKSIGAQNSIDAALSKAPSLNTKQKTAQKTTPYQITFELTKAGNFSFNVVDSTTVKNPGQVSIVTLEGKTGTVSPTYTLTDAKYKELIPPAVTPTPTPVATKPTMVVDSAPKYSVVSNKVNAALNVIVVGDLALTKDNIKLSTNTAGATVKSVTAQKAVDATLSKSKPLASLKATAKTTGYVITFELAKAGNYSFGVIPSTTAKSATQIEIASIDGKTGTVSPTYTLTEAEYNKLIPPAQTTPTPTPVAKPSVLVSNTANYSVVSSKVNATVNIVVLGDLSLTKDNIKLSTNTAGATVKSIGAQNSIDAALSKAPSLNTKQKTAQKTTPYQITFELTKAGNFSFNVVDSTTVKNPGQVEIVTLDGKTGTVLQPTHCLMQNITRLFQRHLQSPIGKVHIQHLPLSISFRSHW